MLDFFNMHIHRYEFSTGQGLSLSVLIAHPPLNITPLPNLCKVRLQATTPTTRHGLLGRSDGKRFERLQYEMLTRNDDWHVLSLKFRIYDCFLLVFCFLLYFQDLCLHVLMLSYNERIGSLWHIYSILFHRHISDIVSSPFSKAENSHSSVLSRARGLHISVNRPNSTSSPTGVSTTGSVAVGLCMFDWLLQKSRIILS